MSDASRGMTPTARMDESSSECTRTIPYLNKVFSCLHSSVESESDP